MQFRADIEGLRAVSILLVVAAHAGIPGFEGGFVGVDVFFVLSGYLITGLIAEEVTHTGRFAFTLFYARRFRRLFPALLVVALLTAVAARELYPPSQQPEQAIAVAWAIVWASNLHFAFARLDYFGDSADTNLFLHTWSLGVEEQFYLLWPLLVLAVFAGGPRRARSIVALALVFVVGFIACVAWTDRQPTHAFYLMPARAWQFALGALAWLAGARLPAGGTVGWVGLVMVVASAMALGPQVNYPGAWALVPSVGGALVLAAGARHPARGAARWLATAPMTAIGRVSYAWYLWHWPVLLLGATVLDAGDWRQRVALAALSGVLAAATYVAVERPTRAWHGWSGRPARAIAATAVVAIAVNALAIRWHNESRDTLEAPAHRRFVDVRLDIPEIYPMGCDEWNLSDRAKPCVFGRSDAGRTAVLVGDSVLAQWFPAFRSALEPAGWRIVVITKASCPMVDEPVFDRFGRRFVACERWRDEALEAIAGMRPQVVVMGSAHTTRLTEQQWRSGTARVLERLASVPDVVVMRSTPTLPFDGPRCLEPRGALYQRLGGHRTCAAPVDDVAYDAVDRAVREAIEGYPNARTIDLGEAVCPDRQCAAAVAGRFVFRDRQHLTASFVESLAPRLADELGRTRQGAAAGLRRP